MQNGQKTIRDLFDGSKMFNIPKYQRAYTWEEKQLEDFVDDIENQRLNRAYFFGTILFQEKGKSENDFEYIDIVDGQQRITTLIIFMKLLLDQVREDGKKNEINRLKDRYIQLYGEYKLQILPDDNDFFKSYILQDNSLSDDNVRTPSQKRLLNAKNHLRQRFKNYLPQTLWDFKEKIENATVLTYSVQDNAEATLIFETTNDRGKSLTNLEKIKSFLMYKTYLTSDSPDTQLDCIQSRFGEIYRDHEEIKNRVEEDATLQYHFIAFEKWRGQEGHQQHVQTIKNTVNKLVNDGDGSRAMDFIDRYSRELKDSFMVMKQLLLSREPHLLDIFALNRPATFYPLLFKAYKFDESNGRQNFKRVARLVEIICFRVYGIRRRRLDAGREDLYRWARDFNGNFCELIDELQGFIEWGCNDAEFLQYLLSPNFYNEISSNDMNYLFYKYENYLRTEEQPVCEKMSHDEFVNRDSRTKFSIEHIIPQNPEEGKVVEDQSIRPEMTQEFQEKYLHCIGNLTIDPISANSSKLNHAFEYKDQRYFRRVPLKTQNELIDFLNSQTRRWDETSIHSRRDKILEFAKIQWNHNAV